MYTDEILSVASSFCGGDKEILETLCISAENELTARLKSGSVNEDFKNTFITAAAFLAAAMYYEVSDGDGVTSYSVGNVSVNREGNGVNYKNLRSQTEIMMAPYINDGGFSFKRVKG